MRRTFACLALAAACAGAGTTTVTRSGGPSIRYRAVGAHSDGGPLWANTLSGGRLEYQLLSASRAGGVVAVERAVVNQGDDPVRLDLGRVRLRSAAGDDAALIQACAGAECQEASAARGQVIPLEPGATLRLRAEFGPIDADEPLEKATFVDEGLFVAGRLALVAVELERAP